MKPIAVFFVIALIPAAVLTAHARTVTAPQGTSNEKSVSGVAGPSAAARNSGPSRDTSQADQVDQSSARHPSKKALKKTKVSPPPPMHDPN